MKEDFEWVLKCITTSTNEFHFGGCSTLISLFYAKYGSPFNGEDGYQELGNQLEQALDDKICTHQ
jgi:hypothetical protein